MCIQQFSSLFKFKSSDDSLYGNILKCDDDDDDEERTSTEKYHRVRF